LGNAPLVLKVQMPESMPQSMMGSIMVSMPLVILLVKHVQFDEAPT
jgi:hypothetical protein